VDTRIESCASGEASAGFSKPTKTKEIVHQVGCFAVLQGRIRKTVREAPPGKP